MMFRFLRLGLMKKGIVTDDRTIFQSNFDGQSSMPMFDLNSCNRCSRCSLLCPTGAISLGESWLRVDMGRCISCGECAAACREVIKMSGDIVTASRNRNGLEVVHRFER